VTGRPHTIEIWFGIAGSTLYMLAGAGERSDWVRNLQSAPAVSVRIGDRYFTGAAHVVDAGSEEDALARRLLLDKYVPRYAGNLDRWGRTALPVGVDLGLALTPPADGAGTRRRSSRRS
jgi:hypothetical protein